MIRRRSPLPPRSSPIRRSAKKIPRLNVERAKRRRDKYAAHLRSAHFKEVKRLVRERSGGRCERWCTVELATPIGGMTRFYRCPNAATEYNHTKYTRVPHELPEDVEHLCKPHEREYENARPWRAERRLALQRATS
jgi:tRNA(Ile2) C34 agmatinyltransferase TiaS